MKIVLVLLSCFKVRDKRCRRWRVCAVWVVEGRKEQGGLFRREREVQTAGHGAEEFCVQG
jgi:hypothetical protein